MAPPRLLPDGEPEHLRIRLLGGFQLVVGSRVVGEGEWRLRKSAHLVKLLALSRGHRLHREQVLDTLWPDLRPRAAANNLHRTLHQARRVLGPEVGSSSRYLPLEGNVLQLAPNTPVWIDVVEYEKAAATARSTGDPAAYRAAVALYGGDLLPENPYEDWVSRRRDELRALYLALLLELATIHERRGEVADAIEALNRLLEKEPAHEEAHVRLMRLYAGQGLRHKAVAQYERLKQTLNRELETEPDPATEQLYQDILTGRFPAASSVSVDEPPRGTPESPRYNLPFGITSFVGRERQMVEVVRLLGRTRLLTLAGSGGCGKTRLAIEAGRTQLGRYADGVWLVELASLSDSLLLPQVVASALGVREQPGRPLTQTLVEYLREKQLLMMLDNCEHLVGACAHLAERLLEACEGLRILATSRETLELPGETTYRVPSLSLPDRGMVLRSEEYLGFEAVRLFVERARSRALEFTLTEENAGAVVEICRRLDGIPLAIELAAARVKVLTVEQILSRLHDPLRLLTEVGRTTGPRHKTLRGVLDWSYDLLADEERRLFRRLSVFAGGWTLEAAEEVCDTEEAVDVLEGLSRLVDKSLVVVEPGADSVLRYRLLEPVRQYALEQLETSGEAEELRGRHAGFYLAVAEQAVPQLSGPEQVVWLDRLDAGHDNFRVALAWLLQSQTQIAADTDRALQLSSALAAFWEVRGYLSEGRRWLQAALDMSDSTSAAARAGALNMAGSLAAEAGNFEQAAKLHQHSLELYRRLDDRSGIAASLNYLGFMALYRGDYSPAQLMLEESLALRRALGDKPGMAASLNALGLVHQDRGDLPRAAEALEESLSLRRGLVDQTGMANSLTNLAGLALLQGDYNWGIVLQREALALYEQLQYTGGVAGALLQLGRLSLRQGDYGESRAFLNRALVMLRELGSTRDCAEAMEALAAVEIAQGRPERATRLFGAAEALREATALPLTAAERDALLHHHSALRAQLDESSSKIAWAEGRAMPLDEAIGFALADQSV